MNDDANDDNNDDELLRALGARARDNRRQELDQALGAWADGRLDARQALSEAAIASDDGHAELFAPLRDEVRDRITARAVADLRPAPVSRTGAAATMPPRRPRRSRWMPSLFGGGVALAAVAAAWLWWIRPAPPLPGYQLAVEGGDRTERAAGGAAAEQGPRPPTIRVLSRESTLTLALRPLTPVAGPVEARLYVRPSTGPTATSAAAAEISPAGAVRWRGTASELGAGLTGDLVLQALVGRPGTLPAPAALPRASSPPPGVASFETAIRVVDPPPP